jgi:catechol 2,3-dioxygenase-like lactoylglutathione lyase family enzyme
VRGKTFQDSQGERGVNQNLALVSLLVQDYDEAIAFFVNTLGFELREDTAQLDGSKRWVVVAPAGSTGAGLLLARAVGERQVSFVGDQSGGRVFLFLNTTDFWSDYRRYVAAGVRFVRPPREEPYGTVAVFLDLCGNQWDLIEPRS